MMFILCMCLAGRHLGDINDILLLPQSVRRVYLVGSLRLQYHSYTVSLVHSNCGWTTNKLQQNFFQLYNIQGNL